MEYYSVLKRNELSSYEKTWRNLQCVLLGERSQSEKAASSASSVPTVGRSGKTRDTVTRSVVGGEEAGMKARAHLSCAMSMLYNARHERCEIRWKAKD